MTVTKEEHRRTVTSVKAVFVILTLLFFAILISYMILLVQVRRVSHKAVRISQDNAVLLAENQKRIVDDRNNKIIQCKHTYSGIKDVFEIFFSKHPSHKQKMAQRKFNHRIADLQKSCEKSAGN